MMNTDVLGVWFLPAGVLCMLGAAFLQVYVMLNHTAGLNRFSGYRLLWVITALFFSFSLAVYCFLPETRKIGRTVFGLGALGVLMYVLARYWLKGYLK